LSNYDGREFLRNNYKKNRHKNAGFLCIIYFTCSQIDFALENDSRYSVLDFPSGIPFSKKSDFSIKRNNQSISFLYFSINKFVLGIVIFKLGNFLI